MLGKYLYLFFAALFLFVLTVHVQADEEEERRSLSPQVPSKGTYSSINGDVVTTEEAPVTFKWDSQNQTLQVVFQGQNPPSGFEQQMLLQYTTTQRLNLSGVTYCTVGRFCRHRLDEGRLLRTVEMLSRFAQLQYLDLHLSGLTWREMQYFSLQDLEMPSLKALELGNNPKIGSKGAQALVNLLQKTTALTVLDISGLRLGAFGADRVELLSGGLLALSVLHMGNNRFGRQGIEAFETFFSGRTALRELDLSENIIGTRAAKALAPKLRGLLLEVLDMHGNAIGNKGLLALAPCLEGITILDLFDTSIGNKGAQAVARHATALIKLRMSRNHIGNDGFVALAGLTTLQKLNLHDNAIGDKGAQAFAQNGTQLTRLTDLILTCNSIGPNGEVALREMQLTSLKGLKLDPSATRIYIP